jgi:hypothetical protein
MIFAPTYSRHERSLVGRLRLLGLDGERASTPRHAFRAELRDQLLAEAGRLPDGSAASAA